MQADEGRQEQEKFAEQNTVADCTPMEEDVIENPEQEEQQQQHSIVRKQEEEEKAVVDEQKLDSSVVNEEDKSQPEKVSLIEEEPESNHRESQVEPQQSWMSKRFGNWTNRFEPKTATNKDVLPADLAVKDETSESSEVVEEPNQKASDLDENFRTEIELALSLQNEMPRQLESIPEEAIEDIPHADPAEDKEEASIDKSPAKKPKFFSKFLAKFSAVSAVQNHSATTSPIDEIIPEETNEEEADTTKPYVYGWSESSPNEEPTKPFVFGWEGDEPGQVLATPTPTLQVA